MELGKQAEAKIKQWLNRPDDGYSFDRIPDQMSGFYNSRNVCDFMCFKSPYLVYIESKATYKDRFDFVQISDYQMTEMLKKSQIQNVFAVVIILFASDKRAFILNIQDIKHLIDSGQKSINIKKVEKWDFRYSEIQTIPNNRKSLLDYTGELLDYIL